MIKMGCRKKEMMSSVGCQGGTREEPLHGGHVVGHVVSDTDGQLPGVYQM
jgi:hypothetical protein